MDSSWTILGLIAVVIGLIFIFPESAKGILDNKLSTFGTILLVFLIGFFVFIKMNQR